ncbi:aminopeptidase C [Philodulcilactobacillus myokoensis]|uniref:Aminopeptidase n=1 Tax=Philodulcilactobacillus myokoensis TaxID=2929573 RepID=A0A9W6B1Q9_9LACO|nr:C1 family peptidase [Philodulcilactobacillus myokoensis]GLB47186.1 aminopeptidase C [Philodulcilactobacillus myokoensis]
MTKDISMDQLKKFQNDYENRKDSSVLERAVSHNGILETSADYKSDANMDPVFSIELDTGDVSNQKRSGRCWLFAALNTMRHHMANTLNLKGNWELSQNYVTFWDKLEKSNYFLENVLKTANKPTDSRKVSWLMNSPQGDGGQWDMLCALIEKYGIVPKSVMPETHSSNNSAGLDNALNLKLRHSASVLRQLVAKKATSDKISKTKTKMLNDIYRMLAYSFGKPVQKFNFEYRDKDGNYHIDQGITPKEFFKKYVNVNLEDYVSLINSPTEDKPFNKTYTIDMLGNVAGGRQIKHLNLTMDQFQELTIKQLKNGESVWFGSDVAQSSDRQKGIMDTKQYDRSALFDTDLSMSKAERLNYKESAMDHAMVITGVDIVDGQPTKWKVENSWGKKVGNKGYFVMSNDWFRTFVYQVVINKKYMSDNLKKLQAQKPIVLKPWDPMGTLA